MGTWSPSLLYGPTYPSEGKLHGTSHIPTHLPKDPRLPSIRDGEGLQNTDPGVGQMLLHECDVGHGPHGSMRRAA